MEFSFLLLIAVVASRIENDLVKLQPSVIIELTIYYILEI